MSLERAEPDYTPCACCGGAGKIDDQTCGKCHGYGRQFESPEIAQLGDLWYVRRAPTGFPYGPGSIYLHVGGRWGCSPSEEGVRTGLYSTKDAAEVSLALAQL